MVRRLSREGSEVEVVTLSLNNPLRVTSTNSPRHGTRTPRAILVEVTNEFIALDRVDYVVSARRTGWRVRVTAGVDQHLLSFGDDVVLVLRRRNLYVLVACDGISVSTNLTSFRGEYSPSAYSLPSEMTTFLTLMSWSLKLHRVMETH